MPRIAYVNGAYVPFGQASVHIEDRGFQFADAVYEVVGVMNGVFADERGHLDRLERSLGELGIPMPVSRAGLRFIMRHVLRQNRFRNAAIYIQVSRGQGKRDFKIAKDMAPNLVVYAWAFEFKLKPEHMKGVHVQTRPDQRWARRDIKTTQLLSQSLAKQAAVDAGYDDTWMVDDAGYVTEASSSNAWIVKGKTLYTRKAASDLLKGVTRTAIAHVIENHGLSWEERAFTPQEAQEADEAFNTSATSLVVPVVKIDGKAVGSGDVGPVTRLLLGEYIRYVNAKTGGQVAWTPPDR
ncbi:MAG: D-amino-acid transaminase [Bdellovibrionales bacterium]